MMESAGGLTCEDRYSSPMMDPFYLLRLTSSCLSCQTMSPRSADAHGALRVRARLMRKTRISIAAQALMARVAAMMKAMKAMRKVMTKKATKAMRKAKSRMGTTSSDRVGERQRGTLILLHDSSRSRINYNGPASLRTSHWSDWRCK